MEQARIADLAAAVVRGFRERLLLSILILVVVPLGFVAYALLTPKVYRAVVTMAPAAPDRSLGGVGSALGDLGGLAALTGLAVGKDNATDEAVAVLRSRVFTERFLESSGAMDDILTMRFHGDPEQRFRVYGYFDSKVRTVAQNRKTGLYTVTIEWFDRKSAASWANAIVKQLNAEMRTRAIEEARRNLGFLDDEIAKAEQVAVRDAIGRLIEVQVKQRMFASVTEGYVFRVIDPAVPADPREHIYPKRFLFAAGGGLLALCLVLAIAMHRGLRQSPNPTVPAD